MKNLLKGLMKGVLRTIGYVFNLLKESSPRGRKSSLARFSAGKTVVECAFCRGSGLDDKLKLSVCPVCGGSRLVKVEPPAVKCAFCRGAGRAPWGGNLTCPVCFGKGAVFVLEPFETCPKCRGTGVNPTGRLYCMNCRGKGVVPAKTSSEELAMAHIVKEESDRALVDCAFCRGKGLDPFGIMSHLSTCYSCLGHKHHWVKTPIRQCPYCHGGGVSPIGGRNYCIVCRGAGVIEAVKEPSARCPACGGSALHYNTSFYCYTCRGRGVVEVSATKHHADKGDK